MTETSNLVKSTADQVGSALLLALGLVTALAVVVVA
jgi:hypothetical protein